VDAPLLAAAQRHTTYTFSIILAVFLIGIGLGSGVGSCIARRPPRAARAGHRAALLIAAIAWTSWNITTPLPLWPMNPRLAPTPWSQFQIDSCVACGRSCRPPACGAPASRSRSRRWRRKGQDGGVVVGRVYAANTVGAHPGRGLDQPGVRSRAIGTQTPSSS
jgi:spermidine synthase